MKECDPMSCGFWGFFIKNYRVTYLLLLAIVIFGLVAIFQIPKESAPEVNIPVVVLTTPLPGSGSESVESLITRPIENQISGLSGVTRITSTSEQSFSSIFVEFEPRVNVTEKIADLRNRVERAKVSFPEEAGSTMVQQISFSDVPIITVVLSGPLSLADLKKYAEDLKDEIEPVRNVRSVNLTGAPDTEVKIKLRQEAMMRLGISGNQVISSIMQANLEAPIGTVETGGGVYALRFDGRLTTVEEVGSIPIDRRGASVITVSDLADVESGFKDLGALFRYTSGGEIPQPAISLRIFKESGQGNILSISDEVMKKISVIEKKFPENISIDVVQNDADIIRIDLFTLLKSGILTVIIILVILSIFLGWREALLAGMVVPLSFFMAFIVIDIWGLTINFLTLFSLILALGILVDASIVVTEGVSSKMSKGLSPDEAVVDVIKEYKAPLVAGTLTTVFVFAPLIFLSGVMAEFIRSIPVTVSAVLLSALFVALAILTTITSRVVKRAKISQKGKFFFLRNGFDKLTSNYSDYLYYIVFDRRRSFLLMLSMSVAFILAILLPIGGMLKVNLFPSPDSDNIFIDIEASPGTPLQKTLEFVEPIEKYLLEDSCVDSFLTVVGQGSRAGSIDMVQSSNSHIAGISVTLCEDRVKTSTEVVGEYQKELSNLKDITVRVTQQEEGPQATEAIRVNILGSDLDELETVAKKIANELRSIDGVENVNDGVGATGGEFLLSINRLVAERYGVTVAGVIDALRVYVSGRVIGELEIMDENIDIMVVNNFNGRENNLGLSSSIDIDDLRSVMMFTPNGPIALDNFLNVTLEPGRSVINRRDGEKVISVTSDTLAGFNAGVLTAELRGRIAKMDLPGDVDITFGGEIEEINDAFLDLGKAMLFGILFIFALLVWQFNSYIQPLIVLTTVPLSMIGVFFGLTLVGQPLSFPGAIGIVALAGIVVNNAIILIDRINKLYSENGERDLLNIVIEGSKTRLRPIILTILTTSMGVLPLAFVSPSWAPVAYSIMFGLIFSTLITLFLVPVLYYRYCGKKRKS